MGLVKLETLAPGTAFVVPGTDLSGTVVTSSFCRVTVKTTVTPQLVEFTDGNGVQREFVAESGGLVSWAPGAEVEVINAGACA